MSGFLWNDTFAVRTMAPRPGTSSALSQPAMLQIDRHRGLAWGGAATTLSPTEVRILHALVDATARVVGRSELAAVANTDARRGLDAHMYRLRMKLRDMPGLTLETVPKRGFRLIVGPPGS